MDIKNLLLSHEGRINRQPYWIATLIIIGANVVAGLIPLVGFLLTLFLIYPSICIYNKRLHDLGKSGWLQLITWISFLVSMGATIAMFVPIAMAMMSGAAGMNDGAVFGAMMAGSMGAVGLILLASLVCIAFHIVIGVLPGQTGENRYGPDPLNAVDAQVF